MSQPQKEAWFALASPTVVPEANGNEESGGSLWSSEFTPCLSPLAAFASEALSGSSNFDRSTPSIPMYAVPSEI